MKNLVILVKGIVIVITLAIKICLMFLVKDLVIV